MNPFSSSRLTILAGLLLALFAILEGRLINLQIWRHSEFVKRASEYQLTTRVEQSWRGPIRDRNGMPLALTVEVRDVYADLALWTNRVELLAGIAAPLLHVDQAELSRRVRQGLAMRNEPGGSQGPGVLLLKRGLPPAEWAPIQEVLAGDTFGLPASHLTTGQRDLLARLRRGVLFAREGQHRYYPQGDLLAQVVGFVGAGDNGHWLQGKWGLEASLDDLLAGQNGLRVSSQDALGRELAFCRVTNTPPKDGARVVLTIDSTLQKIVEAALDKVVLRYRPIYASCVIIRPSTGEILALGIRPAFAPERPDLSPQAAWCNHVISDRCEVGSVFKVITLAAALELGLVRPDEPVYCENGRWLYQGSILHDDGHRYDWLTVRECLARSSNIGLAKIALRGGSSRLRDFITRFGLDRRTGVPLPYETMGFVRPLTNWTASSITRVAIGQEFAVSQLQLAMAYAAIANDGVLMHPLLVRELDRADGTLWARYEPKEAGRVVRAETARQLREVMQGVVENGTGTAAALPNYTVAGKTGTGQKSDGRHYLPGRYYCSFVGLVPAGKPELVIAVAVDEPKDSAYGGVVAAPVFREIAAQAVGLCNIAPDKEAAGPRRLIVTGHPPVPGNLIAAGR